MAYKLGRSFREEVIAFGARLSSRCARFGRATSGATAIEFAFVAPPLLLTILFLLSIGYVLILNQALDYATQKAARLVRTGYVQGATTNIALTQTQFRTQVVCPLLPSMFNCNNVIVNLQAVPYTYVTTVNQYYTYVNSNSSGLIMPALDNTQTSYCPGNPKGYVYLQILYPVNFFFELAVVVVPNDVPGPESLCPHDNGDVPERAIRRTRIELLTMSRPFFRSSLLRPVAWFRRARTGSARGRSRSHPAGHGRAHARRVRNRPLRQHRASADQPRQFHGVARRGA